MPFKLYTGHYHAYQKCLLNGTSLSQCMDFIFNFIEHQSNRQLHKHLLFLLCHSMIMHISVLTPKRQLGVCKIQYHTNLGTSLKKQNAAAGFVLPNKSIATTKLAANNFDSFWAMGNPNICFLCAHSVTSEHKRNLYI